jgi:CRP-like cAMP-binding protein
MNDFPLTSTQISAVLGRLGYFRDLAEPTLHRLSAGARQTRVSRDEVVYRKGDPADELFVVVSGQIKIALPQTQRKHKVLSLVDHGESFGIAALWLGLPHPTHAVASKDSHLLVLDRRTLVSQTRQEPRLAERLLTDLSRRVMDLMRDLESCTPRSSLQRVSCFLLQQRPAAGIGSYEILLPSTKRDIAAKLNLTQETLSRTLTQLGREGAIQVRGRLIQVLDSEKLAHFNQHECPPEEGIAE